MEIDFEEIIEDIITTCRHPSHLTRKIIIEYVEYINSQETERRVIHEKINCMRCGKIPVDTTSNRIKLDEEETSISTNRLDNTTETNKTIMNSVIDKLETQ